MCLSLVEGQVRRLAAKGASSVRRYQLQHLVGPDKDSASYPSLVCSTSAELPAAFPFLLASVEQGMVYPTAIQGRLPPPRIPGS